MRRRSRGSCSRGPGIGRQANALTHGASQGTRQRVGLQSGSSWSARVWCVAWRCGKPSRILSSKMASSSCDIPGRSALLRSLGTGHRVDQGARFGAMLRLGAPWVGSSATRARSARRHLARLPGVLALGDQLGHGAAIERGRRGGFDHVINASHAYSTGLKALGCPRRAMTASSCRADLRTRCDRAVRVVFRGVQPDLAASQVFIA